MFLVRAGRNKTASKGKPWAELCFSDGKQFRDHAQERVGSKGFAQEAVETGRNIFHLVESIRKSGHGNNRDIANRGRILTQVSLLGANFANFSGSSAREGA